MEREIKKLVEEELESKIKEIEERFQAQIEKELGEVKEQLRVITVSTNRIEEIEKDFQRHVIAGEISDNWNVLVKLRSHSYEKLMSEYKKVEKKILIEGKPFDEVIDKEPKDI